MQLERVARGVRRMKARCALRPNGVACVGTALSIALAFAMAESDAAEALHRVVDATSSSARTHPRATHAEAGAPGPTPHAPQDHFEITAHIVAAGVSKPSSSACFHMDATIGEPVAGTSTSTHYILQGGFMAPRTTRRDEIFSNPFESCTP